MLTCYKGDSAKLPCSSLC